MLPEIEPVNGTATGGLASELSDSVVPSICAWKLAMTLAGGLTDSVSVITREL